MKQFPGEGRIALTNRMGTFSLVFVFFSITMHGARVHDRFHFLCTVTRAWRTCRDRVFSPSPFSYTPTPVFSSRFRSMPNGKSGRKVGQVYLSWRSFLFLPPSLPLFLYPNYGQCLTTTNDSPGSNFANKNSEIAIEILHNATERL